MRIAIKKITAVSTQQTETTHRKIKFLSSNLTLFLKVLVIGYCLDLTPLVKHKRLRISVLAHLRNRTIGSIIDLTLAVIGCKHDTVVCIAADSRFYHQIGCKKCFYIGNTQRSLGPLKVYTESTGFDRIETKNPLVTDGCCLLCKWQRNKCPVRCLIFYFEGSNTLSEFNILLQQQTIHFLRCIKRKRKYSGRHTIRRCPIGIGTSVTDTGSFKPLPTHLIGRNLGMNQYIVLQLTLNRLPPFNGPN